MSASAPAASRPHFASPPGGLLVWIFIVLELLVFGAGFVVVFALRADDPEAFAAAQAQLNRPLAIVNTLVLLTSGYLVLLANHRFDAGQLGASAGRLLAAAALGSGFLVLKGVEYAQKLELGLTTSVSPFLDLYWMLTGFHAAHVLLGVLILLGFAARIRAGRTAFAEDLNLKTGSAFWHMCDLIWVLLFPTVYLL